MANLNLGQDVANERERKKTAAHKVAIFYPLWLAVRMRRYGSLFNISPSGFFSSQKPFFATSIRPGDFRELDIEKEMLALTYMNRSCLPSHQLSLLTIECNSLLNFSLILFFVN